MHAWQKREQSIEGSKGVAQAGSEPAVSALQPLIKMVSQGRFELPTFPLGGGCSIQLSYWDLTGGGKLSHL